MPETTPEAAPGTEPGAGARARERVLREFPVEMRRRGLYEAIEELWSSTQAS
jgi:hypothetical protein